MRVHMLLSKETKTIHGRKYKLYYSLKLLHKFLCGDVKTGLSLKAIKN